MKRIAMLGLALVIAAGVIFVLGRGADAQDGGDAGAGHKAILDLAGCGASSLPANDDDSTGLVNLPFSANFFGTTYNQLYVNNNGNVTFDSALSAYTPFNIVTTARVIIAPFFGDVDTRGAGSGVVTYGATTFSGRPTFCVNWIDVGYFSARTNRLNSFQLLLVDRSDVGPGDFDMIFNYDQIQWETGEASGGTDGLGGSSARVGYSNGSDASFELPGSAVNGAFLDSNPGGLIHQSRNSVQNGRYMFNVRNGVAPTGGFVSGRVFGASPDGGNLPLAGAPVQICRQDVVPAVCSTTTTDANGDYTVAGLPAGTYNGVAGPPADRPDLFPDVNDLFDLGNNQGRIDYDFKLLLPRPRPDAVQIDSISQTSGGAPVLNWSVPVQITSTNPDCTGGSGEWELVLNGQIIASGAMVATPTAGVFKGTIPPLRPAHGPAVLTIEMFCPGAGEDKVLVTDVYIDPSGHVRTVAGAPIVGATVTLYRSDNPFGPFAVVPDGSAIMSPSNRTNPDMTDEDGFFHWDVIAGYYVVRAQAAGCNAPGDPSQLFVETEVLTIPPPALDLDIRLQCGGEPVPTPTPAPTVTVPQNGDVDCSGTTNSIDAAILLQRVAGLLQSFACNQGDVNRDGMVNSIDAAIILQHAAGLIGALPV